MPTNTALHRAYNFAVKVSASGSNPSFGTFNYVLNIGCFAPVATYSDAVDFVTSIALYVGDPYIGVYDFKFPTANANVVNWCTIES